MEAKVFKEKFKKGQNVTTQKWLDNDDDTILKYIGLDGDDLFVEWEDGDIHIMNVTEYDWILHPVQEKTKDLEGVFEFILLLKSDATGIEVIRYLGDKKRFDFLKDKYKDFESREIITLEEAKERGLKV